MIILIELNTDMVGGGEKIINKLSSKVNLMSVMMDTCDSLLNVLGTIVPIVK